MMRVLALGAALVLAGIPVATTPLRPIVAGSGLALVMGVAGVATLRRGLATSAACAFVADYALALGLADAGIGAWSATAFGLALVLMLQSLELARCGRDAVLAGMVRSHLTGWTVFALVVPGVVVLALGLSRGIASSVPVAVAPLLAAVGTIGVLLGLAAALNRASSRD